MPIITNFRYRPEIDGLRALAVLAVLFFHAKLSFSGGYIGVDVFFVISGFLITSLIWKDLEADRFSFAHFWERRARRILPALFFVTIPVLIAGYFFLLPSDFRALGRATAFQSVFAANIHYWLNTGYFDGATSGMPLLHTWSLAVEEQFYFIAPFLLWGIFGFRKLRSRSTVISILSTIFILSFALSIFQVNKESTSAFYFMPARAWELLCGALVAFLPMPSLLSNRRDLRELFSLIGIALILIPIFVYTSETPFPGLAALPPCVGTALLIWANGKGKTYIGSVLSLKPVVFIGLISYSLYLWHWPFLAFANYVLLEPPTILLRVTLLCISFLCATISWKYVETPFRKKQIGVTRKSMYAFAGASIVILFLCGFVYWIPPMKGYPQRYSAEKRKFAEAKTDKSFINELTLDDIHAGKVIPLGILSPKQSTPPAPSTIFVWGDSHAMAILPAVDEYLKEKKLTGVAVTHSSTAPVLNWFAVTRYGLNEQAVQFNDAVFSYIRKKQIPYVILSAKWNGYSEASPNNGKLIRFNTALLETVQQLISIGTHPIILLDVPDQPFNIPDALSSRIYSTSYITSHLTEPTAENRFDGINPETIAAIKKAGGTILDPKPRFLSSDKERYIIQKDGTVLYRDDHHLTASGAKLIILPFLRDSLKIEK